MKAEVKIFLQPQDVTEIILQHLRNKFSGVAFEKVHYKMKEVPFIMNGKEYTSPQFEGVEITNVKMEI